jgi:hypothetical protein
LTTVLVEKCWLVGKLKVEKGKGLQRKASLLVLRRFPRKQLISTLIIDNLNKNKNKGDSRSEMP